MLAVSMAVKKLSAKAKKLPLYKTFFKKNNYQLPYPLMNIINGGAHANNGLRIQEFMIRPDKAKSFTEAMRICFLVIKSLSKLIKDKGLSTSVGDEGGFAPMISSNNQALDLIVTAIKKAGFKNGKDVSICLDPSKLINNASIRSWLWILWPFNFLEIFVFTKLTAVKTLFPRYLLLFISLFSKASNVPVDAPDGQIAEALLFFIKTSASTVGFPLLSNTWRAFTFKILLTAF